MSVLKEKALHDKHHNNNHDSSASFHYADLKAISHASDKLSTKLRLSLFTIVLILALCVIIAPVITLLKLTAFIAWLSVIIGIIRLAACLQPKPKPFEITPDAANEPIKSHPPYTVLVPLFHEANIVESLMNNLEALDYPEDKLEIFLICEIIDPITISAVKRRIRPPFELIVVPKGTPQTKPRALNYALQFSRGRYVTIYDAEDRPHPKQLKTALAAFKAHPEWAALQAPLDYYNISESFIARQFALEYAALFHVRLPYLGSLGAPFPLGGTSNHMRRECLDMCGGWDSHNVTEDADLSFRLAAQGQKIGYITPPTIEEAVATYKAWRPQRIRWMKGYIQTWLVHMNQPYQPIGKIGVKRFLTLQITLGYTLLSSLLFTPFVCLASLYTISIFIFDAPNYISWTHMTALLFSMSIGILIGITGAIRRRAYSLIPWAFLMPFYWTLLFWPTVQAIFELRSRPFHWHKTTHGVSRQTLNEVS